jgi:hypothetical protein
LAADPASAEGKAAFGGLIGVNAAEMTMRHGFAMICM